MKRDTKISLEACLSAGTLFGICFSIAYGLGIVLPNYLSNVSLDSITAKSKYNNKIVEYQEGSMWGNGDNYIKIRDETGETILKDNGITLFSGSISRNINDKNFDEKKASIDEIHFPDGGVSFRGRSTIEYNDGFYILSENKHRQIFAKYDCLYNAIQEQIKKELEK